MIKRSMSRRENDYMSKSSQHYTSFHHVVMFPPKLWIDNLMVLTTEYNALGNITALSLLQDSLVILYIGFATPPPAIGPPEKGFPRK